MNSSANGSTGSKIQVLMSDEAKFYFDFWFGTIVSTPLAILTMIANVLNMVVFVKMGFQERVNYTLFWLSVCDFVTAGTVSIMSNCHVGDISAFGVVLDADSTALIMAWTRCMFVDVSSVLTVYVSVERCMCILRPFTFNTTFLVRHAKAIMTALSLFVIINYLPIFFTFDFHIEFNLATNSTILFMTYSDVNLRFQLYNDMAFGFLFTGMCQICIFFCAVVMHHGLRKTSTVRESTSQEKGDSKGRGVKGSAMSAKERRMVRMILILASLYMVISVPQILFLAACHISPDLTAEENYNIHITIYSVGIYLGVIYGCFSTVIYFKCSTNYRAVIFRAIGYFVTKNIYEK
uniref:G-protein coupled receptors family 1 profile domain-containing protein n=1 Tax=Biomphalaria glabrata TaxID=6526 RepID=A0A2C9LY58_BIOGL